MAPSTLKERDVLPTEPWHLRTLLAVAALCGAQAVAQAQPDDVEQGTLEPAAAGASAEPDTQHAQTLEELLAPVSDPQLL